MLYDIYTSSNMCYIPEQSWVLSKLTMLECVLVL